MSNRPVQSWVEPTNTHLIKLASTIGKLPDYVKQADMESLRPSENTKVASFADVRHRDYPCHTKAATFLSYADYKLFGVSKLATSTDLENRLNHFVDFYQIRHDTNEVDKLASRMATGYPDDHYAFVSTTEKGAKVRTVRIKDAGELKTATEFLQGNLTYLNFPERQKIASRILDRRNKLAAAMTSDEVEFLEKQAGIGEPESPQSLIAGLEARARHCKLAHPVVSERFSKIAAQAKTNPIYLPAQLTKLAIAIEQADGLTGLYGNYTDRLPSPNDLVFGSTPTAKTAAAANIFRSPTGRVYHASDLQKVALADVTQLMGTDFTTSVRDGVHLDPAKLQTKMAQCNIGQQRVLETLFDRHHVRFEQA